MRHEGREEEEEETERNPGEHAAAASAAGCGILGGDAAPGIFPPRWKLIPAAVFLPASERPVFSPSSAPPLMAASIFLLLPPSLARLKAANFNADVLAHSRCKAASGVAVTF